MCRWGRLVLGTVLTCNLLCCLLPILKTQGSCSSDDRPLWHKERKMRRKDDNINLVEKGIMAKNKVVSNKIKVISFHMRSDSVTKKKNWQEQKTKTRWNVDCSTA